jgi:hypothetical protein
VAALLLGLAACSCGATAARTGTSAARTGTNPYVGLPPDVRPRPLGPGPAYVPPALSAAVARRARIDGMRCLPPSSRRYGVHLELFAHRFVIHIPAGIGVAPPQRRRGVYVLGGACEYPVRSLEPTGVFQVTPGRVLDLGDLFALWGQRLATRRLLSFRGTVAGFLDGHRWHGPLDEIPLHRHAEIVLEVDGFLPPHPSYEFAPGL